MPLTDVQIRAFAPPAKQRKVYDSTGLFLLLAPSGGKWWRFRYRFRDKAKMISFGTYPAVGLKQARTRRDEARGLLARGLDPGAQREASKRRIRRSPSSLRTGKEAVYFIQASKSGLIKVGASARPRRRLATLQTASAEKLVILHIAEGGYEAERAIHQDFRKDRVEGEWFKPSAALLQRIQSMRLWLPVSPS